MSSTDIGLLPSRQFLAVNTSFFSELKNNGFTYDITIEEGYQLPADGLSDNWPYTLNNGSPSSQEALGHAVEGEIRGGPVRAMALMTALTSTRRASRSRSARRRPS